MNWCWTKLQSFYKKVLHVFFSVQPVVDYTVVEELREELREKQMNLNSIKLDTNLFEGNCGRVCVSVPDILLT